MMIGYISPQKSYPEKICEFIDMKGHKVIVGCRKIENEVGEVGLWFRVHDSGTGDVASIALPLGNVAEMVTLINGEAETGRVSAFMLLPEGDSL
jgi:hypothetical protein